MNGKSLNFGFKQKGLRLKNKNIIFTLCLLVLVVLVCCKSKPVPPKRASVKIKNSSAEYPNWIAMMNDSNVNYYKAVEAFNSYWEHRERPVEADGEGKDIFGKEKTTAEKEKEEKRSILYVYEYKQFLNWQQQNKNLVKPDGTIMTPEELLEQWKKSKNDTLSK